MRRSDGLLWYGAVQCGRVKDEMMMDGVDYRHRSSDSSKLEHGGWSTVRWLSYRYLLSIIRLGAILGGGSA